MTITVVDEVSFGEERSARIHGQRRLDGQSDEQAILNPR